MLLLLVFHFISLFFVDFDFIFVHVSDIDFAAAVIVDSNRFIDFVVTNVVVKFVAVANNCFAAFMAVVFNYSSFSSC